MQVFIRKTESLALRPHCRKGCYQVLNLSSARMRATRSFYGTPCSLSTLSENSGDFPSRDKTLTALNRELQHHKELTNYKVQSMKEIGDFQYKALQSAITALGSKIGDVKTDMKDVNTDMKDVKKFVHQTQVGVYFFGVVFVAGTGAGISKILAWW
jgi:hypothetical protein